VKAIMVTDQAAGTAGMALVERPEAQAAGNDVVVQVHASGFTSGELAWPSTWTDRLGRHAPAGRLRTNIGNVSTLDDAVAAVVAPAMWREMPQIVLLSYRGSKVPQNRVCDRDMEKEIR